MVKRRNIHPLKKTGGIYGTLIATITSAAEEFGISDEALNKAIGSPNSPIVRKWMEDLAGPTTARQGLRVISDPNKSVSQLVADGHYDWANDEITDNNIKLIKKGPFEIWVEYIHLGHRASDTEVDAEHERRGLIPLEPEYMLALGVQHPEEQREHPIASMYNAWADHGGSQRFLYLHTDFAGRNLNLHYRYADGRWDAYTRFAARRK